MSISYCPECKVFVEGETIFCRGCDSDICLHCGNCTTELSEDDPREEKQDAESRDQHNRTIL